MPLMKTSVAVAMAGISGLLVTAVLGFPFIPWLRKLRFGQTILDIGPGWHKSKQGTPTMGGLMFIIGTVAAILVTAVTDKIAGGDIIAEGSLIASEQYTKLWSGVLMALAFALIGFVDDYIKAVKHRNLGLTIKEKTVAQMLVIVAYLTSLYMDMHGQPYMFVPFVGIIEIGFFYWIFGIVVIYAAINAVNFTDGVDGLCSSIAATTAVSLAVIAALKGLYGFSMASSALAGACVGFLLWNKNPAKVFMGDTGSLFLGGMLVAIAYSLNCPLILLLSGLVFVIEGASDVLQIVYYRVSGGKRIFKMAPIHHHFEMCGWSEKKIVRVFTLVNIIGGAAAVALMYYGGYIL
ncbi:MAG: phospho-N-acetylmuramoyl-pentapeptide-transferase [Clostridia bacterium]|nr:phospho-N-acetylmuramoyl-pentapeptide-transferase [Clostridia bacterium]